MVRSQTAKFLGTTCIISASRVGLSTTVRDDMICSCRYFSVVLWCPLTRRTGGRVVTDGNSGFFTTYDNVVADSPGALWLSVNSCKPPPNRIYDCYVDNASFHNETLMNCDCSPDPSKSGNCTATNITIVPDSAAWPVAAKAIMGSAGP